jgi:hypothetical protein
MSKPKADVSVDGMDLVENTRGLPMETEDLYLPVDPFGHGDDRFIQRAPGNGQFFAESGKKLK